MENRYYESDRSGALSRQEMKSVMGGDPPVEQEPGWHPECGYAPPNGCVVYTNGVYYHYGALHQCEATCGYVISEECRWYKCIM
jgi:hypothetical protein